MDLIGKKIRFGMNKSTHQVLDFRPYGEGRKDGVVTLVSPTGKICKCIRSNEGTYKKLK